MPVLQQLSLDHAAAVLEFERTNRAYFAASVSDRGEKFFETFEAGFRGLLADQANGACAYYVLVDEDGAVLGRFNLYGIGEGGAGLGYRVAERAAGRGVATAVVRDLCRLAADRHGLARLTAATSHANAASRRVLEKAGFVAVGPADPTELGGKAGTRFVRGLQGV